MQFETRMIATAIIMFGSAAMILARRYGNSRDSSAGAAIAGWTIILVLHLWW